MKMNRFILILAILNISYTLSQEGKMSFERLKAIKMTFITEKIGLNENEESFFWRIYNDFEKKIYERSSQKIRFIRKKIEYLLYRKFILINSCIFFKLYFPVIVDEE